MRADLQDNNRLNAPGSQVGNNRGLSEMVIAMLTYKPDLFQGSCNQCGGQMTLCRPQHPGGEPRLRCATCLDDKIYDVISYLRTDTQVSGLVESTPLGKVGDANPPSQGDTT